GGYSIQGALPYVNLGLCLSMAGVDYSHIREPNYNPELLRQDERTGAYIEELCRQLPRLYFDPPPLKPGNDPRLGVISGDRFIRNRQIYYDTDGINEVQQETVVLCDKCRGLYKVESRADSGPLCLGVEIPPDACPDCKSRGYRLVEDGQLKGNYRYIQLINRLDREYVRFGF
ncbi:MAG: histone deacetylase, partial [Pseudodesulfovibrio sp.]